MKIVTLVICSIQWLFIRGIWAKFHAPNSAQSQDTGQDADRSISDFQIFGQSFINKNCHNSRICHDIYKKLGPVTKLDKRNTGTLRKRYSDVMFISCDVMFFFPIYGQFAAIQKPYLRSTPWKSYIFINNNTLTYKTWKQNWKISKTALILLLWVKVLFLQKKKLILLQKKADSKIKEVLVLKDIFCKTTYVFLLTYQLSSF